jgi:hypothetical protein
MPTAPSAPITAISAVDKQSYVGADVCFDPITQYAPP